MVHFSPGIAPGGAGTSGVPVSISAEWASVQQVSATNGRAKGKRRFGKEAVERPRPVPLRSRLRKNRAACLSRAQRLLEPAQLLAQLPDLPSQAGDRLFQGGDLSLRLRQSARRRRGRFRPHRRRRGLRRRGQGPRPQAALTPAGRGSRASARRRGGPPASGRRRGCVSPTVAAPPAGRRGRRSVPCGWRGCAARPRSAGRAAAVRPARPDRPYRRATPRTGCAASESPGRR